jgi:hypothetical protein
MADSEDEYTAALENLHPDGVDIVSVHHPVGPVGDGARFGDHDPNAVALIERTAAIAHALGKALYVGEFGEKRAGSVTCSGATEDCGGDPARTNTRRVLDALVESRTDWSALWAFDFFQACDGVPTCDTVTDDEEILDAFAVHNSAYTACASAPEGAPCPIGRCSGGVCAPVESARFSLDSAGDVAAWSVATDCTNCTPGELLFVADGAGGYARVSSHDLPCDAGSGCTAAAVRAVSPESAIPAGHAILTLDARSSAPGAEADLVADDAGGAEIGRFPVGVRTGNDFQTVSVWAALPAGTAAVRVGLVLPAANATLDADSARIVWEP